MKWRKKSLTKTFNKDFTVEIKKLSSDIPPIQMNKKDRIVTINELNKVIANFPSKERQFLKEVLMVIFVAQEKYPNNVNKQRNLIYDLLLDLSKKYPKPSLKYDPSTTGKK